MKIKISKNKKLINEKVSLSPKIAPKGQPFPLTTKGQKAISIIPKKQRERIGQKLYKALKNIKIKGMPVGKMMSQYGTGANVAMSYLISQADELIIAFKEGGPDAALAKAVDIITDVAPIVGPMKAITYVKDAVTPTTLKKSHSRFAGDKGKAMAGLKDMPMMEGKDKIVCPNCGHHNHAGVDKCSKCGHPRSKGNWEKASSENLNEQATRDWKGLAMAYYKCRLKAAGGTAGDLHRLRVQRHVAQAKKMPNGWNKLVAHINKKYPGCWKMNEAMAKPDLYSQLDEIAEQAHDIWDGEKNQETMDFAKSIAKATIDLVDDKNALADELESVAKIVASRLCAEFDGGEKNECLEKYVKGMP